MANDEKVTIESKSIKNKSRRKAVKILVGGVTAVAAYNALPARWGTPIIEQVFLPAHAATSGMTITGLTVTHISGNSNSSSVVVNITGQLSPPEADVIVGLAVTSTP